LSLIILAEISVLENNDGSIGNPNKWFSIMERSNAKRQEGPHVHMVHFQTESLCCLMIWNDKVYSYKYNQNRLHSIKSKRQFAVEAGSGPRHLTFKKGMLIKKQLFWKSGFKGTFSPVSISTFLLTENFLYASNRGEANTISTFRILKTEN
jgi:6-phosphogluconolactonase